MGVGGLLGKPERHDRMRGVPAAGGLLVGLADDGPPGSSPKSTDIPWVGQTAFVRMPYFPRSKAAARTTPLSPALPAA